MIYDLFSSHLSSYSIGRRLKISLILLIRIIELYGSNYGLYFMNQIKIFLIVSKGIYVNFDILLFDFKFY